jgi:hypothetical protein
MRRNCPSFCNESSYARLLRLQRKNDMWTALLLGMRHIVTGRSCPGVHRGWIKTPGVGFFTVSSASRGLVSSFGVRTPFRLRRYVRLHRNRFARSSVSSTSGERVGLIFCGVLRNPDKISRTLPGQDSRYHQCRVQKTERVVQGSGNRRWMLQ